MYFAAKVSGVFCLPRGNPVSDGLMSTLGRRTSGVKPARCKTAVVIQPQQRIRTGDAVNLFSSPLSGDSKEMVCSMRAPYIPSLAEVGGRLVFLNYNKDRGLVLCTWRMR